MWIFLNNAFLSVVAHRTRPDLALVRARVKGDLERVFPKAKVQRTPLADYLYRAEVDWDTLEATMRAQIEAIEYPNFKGSVREHDRHQAYADVWGVMYHWQERRARLEPPEPEKPSRQQQREARVRQQPDLSTGMRLRTHTGLEVQVEQVQADAYGEPRAHLVYLASGKRFSFDLPRARRWLAGAQAAAP